MEEKAREYKKRVDEEWINNEKNKEKLIKKIDEYELLDKKYKTLTKQQILENFSRNQKAEKESEKYLRVVSELWDIDEKYKELEELKEKLNQKIWERESIKKQFNDSELKVEDETTLNMQITNMQTLMEEFNDLEKEIVDIEKEITNREQEIQEIESEYWEKEDVVLAEQSSQTEAASGEREQALERPSTLKAHHEQTIKDLWDKDRTRKEIIDILDEWTWIDDELKESIKKEVSDKFFEYYDKKQWDVKTQAARFMKNKLKGLEIFEELRSMPEEDKEEKLKEIEEWEQIYWAQVWSMRLLLKLEKEGFNVKSTEIEECWIIAWKPVFKVKDKHWCWRVYWWLEPCGGWYKEIWEIQNIWDKPCFKVQYGDWDWSVYQWTRMVGMYYQKIWEIQNIWNKLCFTAMVWCRGWRVYWWNKESKHYYEEIWEIKNVWWRPVCKDASWNRKRIKREKG